MALNGKEAYFHSGAAAFFQKLYSAETTYAWQEVSPDDIQSGDTVIVTMTNSSGETYALYNANGTSSAPNAVSVRIVNSKVLNIGSQDSNKITWIVEHGENFTFSKPDDTSNKLYCTDTNNGVRVGDVNNTQFKIEDDYLYNIETSRYLGVYSTKYDWRCYQTINDNIAGQTLHFWKYDEGDKDSYTVTWKDEDGNVIENEDIVKGMVPAHEAPAAKEGYIFSGWTDGVNTYSADALPAVNYRVTYTAVYSVSQETVAVAAFHSISLNGDIGINFYMELSDDVIAHKDTAILRFTIPTGTGTDVKDLPVNEAVIKEVNGKTCYVFTCGVAAKEMTKLVKAQVIDGENSSAEYTYSVRKYASYLIYNSQNKKLIKLMSAMLNYGAYAQLYFDPNTAPADLANVDHEEDISNVNADTIADKTFINQLNAQDIFAGATLSLKSETTLSLYFDTDTQLDFSCEENEQEYDVETVKNGKYQVARIRGISSKKLKAGFTLTVNEKGTENSLGTIAYSPMTYCSRVLSDDSQLDSLKDLVRALYLYADAADKYFF